MNTIDEILLDLAKRVYFNGSTDVIARQNGVISNDTKLGEVQIEVEVNKAKAQLEVLMARERLELLKSTPWKESKKYGINNPYITKAWYLKQVSELNKIIESEG